MGLPVTTVVSGIDSMAVLEQNVAVARGFTPMTAEERAELLTRTATVAGDGKYEPFKTTHDFEADEGRIANNFPMHSEAAD